MHLSEINTQRILALTKSALHGTDIDENLFLDVGETEWNELFEHSALQGVMVLSLIGAMKLPREMQPPQSVKLRWVASANVVEKRYLHRLETAKELSAFFRENHIRMLLMKGFALSRFYPTPYSREFGDIDIFLCGRSMEGNALLERLTRKKRPSSKKHSAFSYKGIMIENHHTFLNHGYSKHLQHDKFLEERLMLILKNAGFMDEINFTDSDQTDETLLFPPPDFDALFVTLHTFSHLPSKIVLRQLCDLTVLFTAYQGKIDYSFYRDTLSEAGLLKLADTFISLLVRFLGLNPEYVPPYESDLSLENKIWNDLLNPSVPPLPKEKRRFLSVFIHKIKLLRSSYWKSELVFPGQYGKSILLSTFYHLRHPNKIGKII